VDNSPWESEVAKPVLIPPDRAQHRLLSQVWTSRFPRYAIGSVHAVGHLVLATVELVEQEVDMESSEALDNGSAGQSPRLAHLRNEGGLRLVSDSNQQQDGSEPGKVVPLVRQAVGQVLDGLSDAKDKVRDAKRLHEIAASVGDEQVETMIGDELRRLEEAAKVA